VVELPEQMLPPPVTVKVGVVSTDSKCVLVLVQLPDVAVTEYVVELAGFTVMLFADILPGCHVYEPAPLAVNVALLPIQIAEGPDMPRLPVLLTLTVT
jgi:hypothetical protein